MARNFLLVDAHNVIFASPELGRLHRRSPAAAREKLVRMLELHQDAGETRVVVVFDGGAQAQGVRETSGAAGVQVFYPRAGQTADAILERLVLKYAGRHRLTVATNDNLVRTAAAAAGAGTMDAAGLFEEIERSRQQLGETLDRLRRKR
jgi:predicted RNA-binding protein with PIN domain